MQLVYSLDEIGIAAGIVLKAAGNRKVMAFEGEMGAGKTTLIQAICRKMGVAGNIGSPTFSIINEYLSEAGIIYHIDLYRCHSPEEAVRAGVEECLYSGNFCLVEWPSKGSGLFPDNTIRLSISQLDRHTRKITEHC